MYPFKDLPETGCIPFNYIFNTVQTLYIFKVLFQEATKEENSSPQLRKEEIKCQYFPPQLF